ncbi:MULTISPECIES: hypothetical protein [unclassified Rhodococcus (in: high G+C Gram-positive bacteria)]|uniref:hypothetical protein n=1 Tax=unclassified Rhodococcus (in: high G+C Gram-positive bacteria) TaxID=192944 RepID=UPI0007BBEC03|nr:MULTISPECIES: hypothetical protein [unclassified Rhodococcus (in: high G+C Gram-positive bacteria)]KZF03006.1 hypothetical protein A2J04_06725 [Rhodococcus sp. EPR-279]KZF09836.1 hypothetical protein A2J02_17830 [Rhodococcus sp. EPR-147]
MTLIHAATHKHRVPPEHRVLGLDRRTFPPAIFVVAVFIVMTFVIPRVDAAIGLDDPVLAGEQMAITESIIFTPATGWTVEEGFRVTDDGLRRGNATVSDSGVTFEIAADSFGGTPDELLDQVEKVTSRTDDPTFRVDGNRTTLTTFTGETGVAQPYSSVNGDGVVAAFVLDGTGLEITAYGPPSQMTAANDNIQTMIASIRTVDGNNA